LGGGGQRRVGPVLSGQGQGDETGTGAGGEKKAGQTLAAGGWSKGGGSHREPEMEGKRRLGGEKVKNNKLKNTMEHVLPRLGLRGVTRGWG